MKLIGAIDNYVLYAFLIVFGLGFDYLRNNPGRQNLLNLDLPANILRSSRQLLTTLVIIMFTIIALKDGSISRLFFFGFIPVFFLLLFATNKYLPSMIAGCVFHKRYQKRTLVVGSSQSVSELWGWLERKRVYGIHIIGLLTNEPNPVVPEGCEVLGDLGELPQKIASTGAVQVFVLDPPTDFGEIRHLSDLCDDLGARLLMVCNWSGVIGRKMDISGDDGMDVLSFY
ncbi:MAG TPA: hypothetical protein VG733_14335, partial [Chthoniobacteraceae bacterium]|nr:hypothetical protein [Chthoniobacteraceae bacterium]